jgi:hypothetical protein
MKPIVSIDIDGVLADELGQLRDARELYYRVPQADTLSHRVQKLSSIAGWWSEFKPLWQPDAESEEEVLSLLDAWSVQVVTKRGPWLEATTMSWLSRYYPWLLTRVERAFFLGPNGHKVNDLDVTYQPAMAIDDSQNVIDSYRAANIFVVAVQSERTTVEQCRRIGVPVVPTFHEALKCVGSVFSS